jgi:surface protein
MSNIKIKIKSSSVNLKFAIAAETPGAEFSSDFSVSVVWDSSNTNTFTSVDSLTHTYGSSSLREIEITGGWLVGNERLLSLPKQQVENASNEFLNPVKSNVVTKEDGKLVFKFWGDYVGFDNEDSIKVTAGTYLFKNKTGSNLTIGATTITNNANGSVTVASSDINYSCDGISGSFTYADSYGENSPNAKWKFWKASTSKHSPASNTYKNFSNLKINKFEILDEDFKLHGIGDFFGYKTLRNIVYSGTGDYTSSVSELKYTFAGCINLRNSSFLTKLACTPSKMIGVMSGTSSKCNKEAAQNWNKPASFGNKIDFSDVTDLSHMFEYSNFDGYIGKWNLTDGALSNVSSMFEGTSYDQALWGWHKKIKPNATVSNMFKDNTGFTNGSLKSRSLNGNSVGAGTMFSGSEMSDNNKHSTVLAAEAVLNATTTTAAPSGEVFSNKTDLLEAVTAWDTSSSSATHQYGDINTWDVSAVTDMSSLFKDKVNIDSLDLSSWDVSNVTTMERIFQGCTELDSITFGSSFDTSNVTNMKYMFSDCQKLSTLDVSSFDTSEVTDMTGMFDACKAATSITFGTVFDASKVTDMMSMFDKCYSLASLDLSNLKTSTELLSMQKMFGDCRALTSITFGTNIDTSNVTDMRRVFAGCTGLLSLDLTHFDTSNVNEMEEMFANCTSLTDLDLGPNFDTSSVNSDMSSMFRSLESIASLDLGSKFDTSGVGRTSSMFQHCKKLTSLDLGSKFDTSSVTEMGAMFLGCSVLSSLTLGGNFGTSNVTVATYMGSMFSGCLALTAFNISDWCVSAISSQPNDFAKNAPFGNNSSNLPNWGDAC